MATIDIKTKGRDRGTAFWAKRKIDRLHDAFTFDGEGPFTWRDLARQLVRTAPCVRHAIDTGAMGYGESNKRHHVVVVEIGDPVFRAGKLLVRFSGEDPWLALGEPIIAAPHYHPLAELLVEQCNGGAWVAPTFELAATHRFELVQHNFWNDDNIAAEGIWFLFDVITLPAVGQLPIERTFHVTGAAP